MILAVGAAGRFAGLVVPELAKRGAKVRELIRVGKGVVEAAKKAGVRRIVFSAVIDPILSALVNHAAKAPVEEAIIDSGMDYTLLHPLNPLAMTCRCRQ